MDDLMAEMFTATGGGMQRQGKRIGSGGRKDLRTRIAVTRLEGLDERCGSDCPVGASKDVSAGRFVLVKYALASLDAKRLQTSLRIFVTTVTKTESVAVHSLGIVDPLLCCPTNLLTLVIRSALFLIVFVAFPKQIAWGQQLNLEWERSYLAAPDSFSFSAGAESMVPSADGGCIISEGRNAIQQGSTYRVFKTDVNGEIVWDWWFDGGNSYPGKRIAKLSNGEYIIQLHRRNESNEYLPTLIWMTEDGEIIQSRTYGSQGDRCSGVFITKSDLIILNMRDEQKRQRTIFKLRADGDTINSFLTNRTYNNPVQLADGRILFTDYVRGQDDEHIQFAFLEADSMADSIGFHVYDIGQYCLGKVLYPIRNGGVLMSGLSVRYNNHSPDGDIVLAQFDANLDKLWSRAYEANYGQESTGLIALGDESIVTCGDTYEGWNPQGVLLHTTAEGELITRTLYQGRGCFSYRSIQSQDDKVVYLLGTTLQNMDDSLQFVTLSKYTGPSTVSPYTDTTSILSGLYAFPNPFNNAVSIQLSPATRSPSTVALYDISGRKLDEWEISPTIGVTNFRLGADLSSGNYYLKCFNGNQTQTLQIVKVQ